MSSAKIRYDLHEHVARITIDRPRAYNAIDGDCAKELFEIANRCSTDKAVRAVVLTGEGDRAFCAGGDVAGFASQADSLDHMVTEMTSYLHMAISRLAWMNAPVLAAVNGVAAGAGLSLVAAADLAIASAQATFTSAYTAIGLSPDGSSTWFLPRLIGRRRSMELYLTNRVLSAAEALDWGLVNQIVPQAELASTVERLAAQLAHGPTQAYGGVKKLMMMSSNDSLESQMERETRQIAELSRSSDNREGVRAFVEKRKPKFTG